MFEAGSRKGVHNVGALDSLRQMLHNETWKLDHESA